MRVNLYAVVVVAFALLASEARRRLSHRRRPAPFSQSARTRAIWICGAIAGKQRSVTFDIDTFGKRRVLDALP